MEEGEEGWVEQILRDDGSPPKTGILEGVQRPPFINPVRPVTRVERLPSSLTQSPSPPAAWQSAGFFSPMAMTSSSPTTGTTIAVTPGTPMSQMFPPSDVPDFDTNLFQQREAKLVKLIEDFMNHPKQNPRRGSMPSERVQNCVKQKYPDLYASVVGSEYANQWHRFIKRHNDIFALLFPDDDGRNLPRIRLMAHEETYRAADSREIEDRNKRERTFKECLRAYLLDHEDDVKVEEFIRAYPTLPHAEIDTELDPNELPPPLPRFRDVVRLVKRHPSSFSYDPDGGLGGPRIRTATTWQPPTQTRHPKGKPKKPPEDDAPTTPVTSPAVLEPAASLGLARAQSAPLHADAEPFRPQSAPVKLQASATPFTPSWSSGGCHRVKSFPVSDSDPQFFPVREKRLRQRIIEFLDSGSQNPHQGSVPSERVQNCIKAQHPDLYKSVVGAGYANQWHRFIQCHGDAFHLFYVDDAKRSVWRIRLETHTNWRQADQRERDERQAKENHWLRCLQSYLELQEGKCCRVDSFMADYNQLPENNVTSTDQPTIPILPARGDFVRFVRRHSEYFEYTTEEYVITLLKPFETVDPGAASTCGVSEGEAAASPSPDEGSRA